MKLSQLIEELQKFLTPTEDPEVLYWNAEWDDHETVVDVVSIETPEGTAVELSGECR